MILLTKYLLYVLLFVMFVGCANDNYKNKAAQPGDKVDTVVSFSIIRKDSTRISNYYFNRKIMLDGMVAFNYLSKADTFAIFFDASGKRFEAKFGSDTGQFELDKTKYYTINGKDFKVLKLVGDKNVTDGAFSLFVNAELGLLLNKSNTWRAAKVMVPEKNSPYYAEVTALLYRMQTDEEFFGNSIPDIKKFTTPKVE